MSPCCPGYLPISCSHPLTCCWSDVTLLNTHNNPCCVEKSVMEGLDTYANVSVYLDWHGALLFYVESFSTVKGIMSALFCHNSI